MAAVPRISTPLDTRTTLHAKKIQEYSSCKSSLTLLLLWSLLLLSFGVVVVVVVVAVVVVVVVVGDEVAL